MWCACGVNESTSVVWVWDKTIESSCCYGVAVVSRIDKIIGLFCRIWFLLYVSFAKETYNLIDPTDRSHPISLLPVFLV